MAPFDKTKPVVGIEPTPYVIGFTIHRGTIPALIAYCSALAGVNTKGTAKF